jgi:hypothetical protein
MRLYLKLALMVALAVLIQAARQPITRAGWEVKFAARCWLAHQLQDSELEARLVEEGRARLAEDLKRAWETEMPSVKTVVASAAAPATTQPTSLAPDVEALVAAMAPTPNALPRPIARD